MIARPGSRRVRVLTAAGSALTAAIAIAIIAGAAPGRPPQSFSGQYDFPGLFGPMP